MSAQNIVRADEDSPRPDDGAPSGQPKPRIDWADPSVPVGNAPPLPQWPWFLSIGAWLGWLVFLLIMLLTRNGESAG